MEYDRMQEAPLLPIRRRMPLSGPGTAAAASGETVMFSGAGEASVIAEPSSKPSILVFDVNETLLDIESLRPIFKLIFGDEKVLREWFGQLALYSSAISLSGQYATVLDLGQGLLKTLGAVHGVQVNASDVDELRMRMLTMPAHPDVPLGLRQLKEAGFRLVSFTSSPPDLNTSPLRHAGLADWFERSLNIDSLRRLGPAAQGYHRVAEELGVDPASLCLVAAHVWDTIGAQGVGYSAALVTRPGNEPLRVRGLPQPQIVAPDLPAVAAAAIARWRS